MKINKLLSTHIQNLNFNEKGLKYWYSVRDFQSTIHSEKDKLASVSYDIDCHSTGYEGYAQAKATVAENTTMPSAPNYKSDTDKIFISSRYAKQPKGTVMRLRDGRVITVV